MPNKKHSSQITANTIGMTRSDAKLACQTKKKNRNQK
jgi:hypothetical protein